MAEIVPAKSSDESFGQTAVENGMRNGEIPDHDVARQDSRSSEPVENGTGRNTPDQKKKIPVENLDRDQLVQQCKKQMILLQKMKQRYDDLQKKHTDLQEEQKHYFNGVRDEEHERLLRQVATLEGEVKHERDLHRRTKEQVTRLSQHSVAELEIRDYTITIDNLEKKLSAKEDCIVRCNEELNSVQKLLTEKCGENAKQAEKIADLESKCSHLEKNLVEARKENLDKEREISALRDDASTLRSQIGTLEAQLGDHASHQSDLVRNYSKLQESLEQRDKVLGQKNAEIARLNVDLSQGKLHLEHVLKDFDEYKLRAQTLLKQQRDPTESLQREKDLEDLNNKVAEMDSEINVLRKKKAETEAELQKERRVTESLKRTLETERSRWEKSLSGSEEKIREMEKAQNVEHQEYRKRIKSYETEIASLKDLHSSTNEKLLQELCSLRQEKENLILQNRESSPKMDDSLGEGEIFCRMKSEDYESRRSEAPSEDSSPISELPSLNRTVSVSASEVASVPPLDKLLNYPNNEILTSTKDVDYKRLKHLSELLHESESTNVRLGEQIRVLKHELRRTESNVEREKHVNNMEYLKNVLMKFLTHRVAQSEQEKLVEVMTTILKLTVEERQQLMKAASVSYIPENVRAWGSYLNPWKSKDT